MKRYLLPLSIVLVAAGLLFGAYTYFRPTPTPPAEQTQAKPLGDALVEVSVPDMEGAELLGKSAYTAKCAACHGVNAAGQDGVAPPLVHKIYEPSHHGDMAFHLAAQQGVRAHHWPFGDMPPVKGLTPSDINNIVAYVRALQRANGIN